ncbi:MAG: hypothetical protein JEY91_16275 [Spirochaetaceae bacterium]|nr:hypothetical protein [Spirochaetaceae bacterium]
MKNIFIALILLLSFFMSCKNNNLIKSSDYSHKEKKIQTLKEYFNLKSEILDTEYEIYDVNMNNRSIPGPTDRDYKVILKIAPDDIMKWHEPGEISSFPLDYSWATEVLTETGNQNIKLIGSIFQYKNKYKEMIIFFDAGIILIRINQQ